MDIMGRDDPLRSVEILPNITEILPWGDKDKVLGISSEVLGVYVNSTPEKAYSLRYGLAWYENVGYGS
jgi:hypothetical protein